MHRITPTIAVAKPGSGPRKDCLSTGILILCKAWSMFAQLHSGFAKGPILVANQTKHVLPLRERNIVLCWLLLNITHWRQAEKTLSRDWQWDDNKRHATLLLRYRDIRHLPGSYLDTDPHGSTVCTMYSGPLLFIRAIIAATTFPGMGRHMMDLATNECKFVPARLRLMRGDW
jgi:hypothetical protein